MIETIVFVLILIVLVAGEMAESDHDTEIDDPLDLARPSVERLQAEAERAFEELRALDRGER